MYTIELNKIQDSDVSLMSQHSVGWGELSDYDRYEFNKMDGGPDTGMQYKFLNYLSESVFENEILIDIGSRAGFSALALALSKRNKILLV